MAKSISVTIRIDEKLKRDAEIACAHLEHNLSSYNQYKNTSTLSNFDPEQRLRELLAKENKGHLTRQERDQKNALLKAGVT